MSHPNQNNSIRNSGWDRESAPFEVFEDPPVPPPIQLMFSTLPNVRVELVSALQEALALHNPTSAPVRPPLAVIGGEPLRRSSSFESPSRQMHYDYETRSWHRISLTVSRDSGNLQDWESRNATQPEAGLVPLAPLAPLMVDQGDTVAEMEEEEVEEQEMQEEQEERAISTHTDLPAARSRTRDKFKRLGTSVLIKIKALGKKKDDPDDKGPRPLGLRRAMSMALPLGSRRRTRV